VVEVEAEGYNQLLAVPYLNHTSRPVVPARRVVQSPRRSRHSSAACWTTWALPQTKRMPGFVRNRVRKSSVVKYVGVDRHKAVPTTRPTGHCTSDNLALVIRVFRRDPMYRKNRVATATTTWAFIGVGLFHESYVGKAGVSPFTELIPNYCPLLVVEP
jgi:hypothetical protein